MSDQVPRRRLAAILAADVVGYSRLMSADEAGTLAALKVRRRDILQPLVAKHHGRVVKVMGDGVLVEFASAVNAVACSVELQEAMDTANADLPEDRRIVLRVGINLGDVIAEGSDLYGDGVNVAARLEALAEPGSVVISGKVQQEVATKLKLTLDDLGEQNLKNIPEVVRVYRVSASVTTSDKVILRKTVAGSKPSIAVLPFTNMSGDPEQEYFSDGITEDIITDLSRISSLFVTARHTAFTFKGKAVEITDVAHKLNVGHVLEGSVRKAGSRIRINAQLIDGVTGGHLWAERYDRDLGDVFALQDEISKSVVSALRVTLLPSELETIGVRTTKNFEAYQRYLRGRSILHPTWSSKADLRAARRLFVEATEIDPGYARAYAGIADCDAYLWINGVWDVSSELMLANSSKAVELAPNLAEAHSSRGIALYLTGQSHEARLVFDKAIALDSGLFSAHLYGGFCSKDTGQIETALLLFEKASDLQPDDWISLGMAADICKSLGRTERSIDAGRRAIACIETRFGKQPDAADPLAMGAAIMVNIGDNERAKEWAKRAMSLDPEGFSVCYNAACAFAIVGESDSAMECLERIRSNPRARSWLLGIILRETQFDPLRGREVFETFMGRLKADVAAQPSAAEPATE
jgi:adenylate cyclase